MDASAFPSKLPHDEEWVVEGPFSEEWQKWLPPGVDYKDVSLIHYYPPKFQLMTYVYDKTLDKQLVESSRLEFELYPDTKVADLSDSD